MGRIGHWKVFEDDGEVVPSEFIVKGVRSKGRYVTIDPDELEPFVPLATKMIDWMELVDFREKDPMYFE